MTNPTIQAIETEYAGHLFRSRLEARWAVFLDTLGIKWAYEAQGLEVDDVRYLPDFELSGRILGAYGVHAEVKGILTADDTRKMLPLARAGGPILLLRDIPAEGCGGPHFELFRRMPARPDSPDGGVELWGVSFLPNRYGYSLYPFGWPVRIGDIDDPGVHERLPALIADRGFGSRDLWMKTPRAVQSAFRAARQARFEHGQSGAPRTFVRPSQ